MHSLHILTDLGVLSCFWQERDYNAVPFEYRFMSQSFVNVTIVYHRTVSEKLDILNA